MRTFLFALLACLAISSVVAPQAESKLKKHGTKQTKQEKLPIFEHATYTNEELGVFLDNHLQGYYIDLGERSTFPYLAEYLEKLASATREEAAEKAQQDEQNMWEHPTDKPMLADIAEGHLSHLLGWMVCASPKAVIDIAVYDHNGLLQGYSSDLYRNKKRHLPLHLEEELFPLLLDESRLKKMDEDIRHRTQPHTFPHIEQVPHKKYGRFVFVAEGIYDPTHDKLLGYMMFLIDPKA